MLVTMILASVVLGCMFYTTLPNLILGVLCLGFAFFFARAYRHQHDGKLDVDSLAQHSKLNRVNPILKLWATLVLILICVASTSPWIGLCLTLLMFVLTVFVGGIKTHEYIGLMSTPLMFLLMSGLALLFDVANTASGLINIPLFGHYLVVTPLAQATGALIMARALGAISCLYFLSLSTPMAEIIGVMRRMKVPSLMIELMYLIYRYTFVLLEMHRLMKNASKSRLGFAGFSTSVKTTGLIYANLMARSYRKAMVNFDAMESRCYDGEIRFLESDKDATFTQVITTSIVVTATFGMAIVLL